jgi:DNA modification methylase
MKACADDGMGGAFNLIYIDPPFFSKRNYDAEVKLAAPAHGTAPTWRQTNYSDAWPGDLGQYLRMLAPRLYGFKELLADTGCLWVHLDWHVVHYAKVLMDEIFGAGNFVNEIIWNYKSGGASKRRFARKHDTLLFYSKTAEYHFNPQKEKSYNRELKPYRFKGVKEYKDALGWYTLVNMKDVWELDMVGRTSKERTGYATQKPESLLLRILESCSEEGDLCGDFFGGSGTMAAAAERLGRRWLSCDQGRLAALSTQKRMAGLGANFRLTADRRLGGDLPGRFEAELNISAAPAGKTRISVRLAKYALPEGAPPLPPEAPQSRALDEILSGASLGLVEYWSVDVDYDGESHKPTAWKAKKDGRIGDEIELAAERVGAVRVRAVDIFGNSSFRVYT